MAKIVLLLMLVGATVKFIAEIVSGGFRSLKKKEGYLEPIGKDWYGNCENCGTLGGLHRLDGKRYCAACYARIKTERDFAKKERKDYLDKKHDEYTEKF